MFMWKINFLQLFTQHLEMFGWLMEKKYFVRTLLDLFGGKDTINIGIDVLFVFLLQKMVFLS